MTTDTATTANTITTAITTTTNQATTMTTNHCRPRLAPPAAHAARLAALLMVATGLTGTGCMLSVEADVPDIQVTQHGIAFQGIPLAGRLGEVSTMQTFSQEHPVLELPAGIDSSIQAVKVELVATSGIADFDFLSLLRVSMRAQTPGAPSVELIAYEKQPGKKVGRTLTVASRNPANILAQWQAKTAVFDLEIAGTLPERDWTIDASIHFAGKASYKY